MKLKRRGKIKFKIRIINKIETFKTKCTSELVSGFVHIEILFEFPGS